MAHRTIKTLILSSVLLLGGCYYDVEEELYTTTDCVTNEMSYAEDILPIIENNCYSCHDTRTKTGNVVLEGYNQLLT